MHGEINRLIFVNPGLLTRTKHPSHANVIFLSKNRWDLHVLRIFMKIFDDWKIQIFKTSYIPKYIQHDSGDAIINLYHTCHLDWYYGQSCDYCVTYIESPHTKGLHLTLITFPSKLRTAIVLLQMTSNSLEINVSIYINIPVRQWSI